MTDRIADLEAHIVRMWCVRCESKPRVVWLGGLTGERDHGYRCNCEHERGLQPVLGNEPGDIAKRITKEWT